LEYKVKIYSHETIIEEGEAKLIIPDPNLYRRPDGKFEPSWAPVFYNPVMRTNRDITVATVKALLNKNFFFVEPLAGTGIRGIRLALESGGEGVINDVDPLAYYYMGRNIRLNNLEGRIIASNNEANTILNNLTFTGIPVDFIDIDPYGSPIPFIDSAFKPLSRKGLLGVTATDTGPLTCSHKNKALRRYWIRCSKVDFDKELGLRILIGNIVKRAASLDLALSPILSYYHRHYFRVIFRAKRSGLESYRIVDECIGYIQYCPENLERCFVKELSGKCLDCPNPEILGPLWICGLSDPNVLHNIHDNVERIKNYDKKALEILEFLIAESNVLKPYIRYDILFGKARKNMPKINYLIEKLREKGYYATRTHFDPRGIRTNAPVEEIVDM